MVGKKPRVIDAEFEVVELPRYRPTPWWRRLYIDRKALLFTLALMALGVAKILLTGSLYGS